MSVNETIICPAKLEELLLKTWSYFVDRKRLFVFTLQNVRDHSDLVEAEGSPPCEDVRLSLSRFKPYGRGLFEVWVEFVVPTEKGIAAGTSEIYLGLDGEFEHHRTIGSLYVR
jgi:hypothetical protein